MLSVKLHLNNGDVIPLELSRSQKERISRTLNRVTLPDSPLSLRVNGEDLDIPWRAIGYLSSSPAMRATPVSAEAAD